LSRAASKSASETTPATCRPRVSTGSPLIWYLGQQAGDLLVGGDPVDRHDGSRHDVPDPAVPPALVLGQMPLGAAIPRLRGGGRCPVGRWPARPCDRRPGQGHASRWRAGPCHAGPRSTPRRDDEAWHQGGYPCGSLVFTSWLYEPCICESAACLITPGHQARAGWRRAERPGLGSCGRDLSPLTEVATGR